MTNTITDDQGNKRSIEELGHECVVRKVPKKKTKDETISFLSDKVFTQGNYINSLMEQLYTEKQDHKDSKSTINTFFSTIIYLLFGFLTLLFLILYTS